MRHPVATFALVEGTGLAAVQEMLGRSGIRVTASYTPAGLPLAEDAPHTSAGRVSVKRVQPSFRPEATKPGPAPIQ